ncbi:MAG: type II toxin-antitoxin system RelE family toxin [Candidatus Dormibacteraceae bacterium]
MPSARRDLNRLKATAASAVLETIDHIADAPQRMGKPLRLELEGLWSARRGPYRVVYRIDEGERLVQIIMVDHRADVYRRARRG